MPGQSDDTRPGLDYLFHPRSIAVVGGAHGRFFAAALIDAGFSGELYTVAQNSSERSGPRTYPSITDIPDTIDYVISAIPAQDTPQLIAECASKGIKAIHLFTAGFSEIDDKEGAQLQSQVAALVRQTGIRIIGPNCMGIHYMKAGLAFHQDIANENGDTAFISQSGGNAIWAIREGATRGLFFSKVISYGNAVDLNECDFLEYLTHDPESRVIIAYVEGVSNGTRFIEALKRATEVKPVIVYKGGLTESGTRAVASHTGVMAGSDRVWDSMLRQAGAIQAHSIEELLDLAVLFKYMPPPKGKAAAVIGIGGGNSVQAADVCTSAGLTIPLLPAETRRKLKDVYGSETGGSFRNPIDMYYSRWDLAEKTIKLVTDCDQIDLLIIHVTLGFYPRMEHKIAKPYVSLLSRLSREIDKPTAIVVQSFGSYKHAAAASESETALYEAGFPVFSSIGQAARAIVKYVDYHNRRHL